MKTSLVSAMGFAATLCATQAMAGDFYDPQGYFCVPKVAYYATSVHYHEAEILTGYKTVAKAYAVPVVTYKTVVRLKKVPIYSSVVYRTVHHYPVYEGGEIYGDVPLAALYPHVACCD